MTVVVTGATGHVGNTLVRALLERGDAVRAVIYGSDERALAGLPVERVYADTRDVAAVRRALSGADLVYHLAAVISIDEASDRLVRAVNVDGTRNVAEACLAEGVRRLVHMSSVHALAAEQTTGPIDETCPLIERTDALAYDRSKADGERAVLKAVEDGLDAVIVSPAAVLGPNDYGPSLLADSVLKLQRRPFATEGAYNWVDVRDVVAGTVAAAERGRRGERYLLSGERLTVRALAELLADQAGGRRPRATIPVRALAWALPWVSTYARWTKRRPLYTAHALRILVSPCDFVHHKARRELGFSPRPMADTVVDALRFYREAGYV
jgi:dihydroflavonol-4-reductase